MPTLFQSPESKSKGGRYPSLPLNDLGNVEPQNARTQESNQGQGKVRVTVLAAAIVALSLRLELYRRISKATECTIDSLEVFLPFLIALYDVYRSQKQSPPSGEKQTTTSASGWIPRTVGSIQEAVSTYLLRPRTRYMLPVFLLAFGCHLIPGLWRSSTSTYICPIVTGEPRTIKLFQFLALFLDFSIAIIAYETRPKADGGGLSGRRCVVLWSSTLLGVSIVWSVVGGAVYLFKPEYRGWLLLLRPSVEFGTLVVMSVHTFLFCLVFISTLHCVSLRQNANPPLLTRTRSRLTAF